MIRTHPIVIIVLILFLSCTPSPGEKQLSIWKSEIMQVEKDFNDLALSEGITTAFATYAAPNAVVKRNGKLIIGNNSITDWYQNNSNPKSTLTWKPDYIDVSQSGDLAYTYGGFIATSVDSSGLKIENTGSFHTVWKRQSDGNWKFVWD